MFSVTVKIINTKHQHKHHVAAASQEETAGEFGQFHISALCL